MILKLKPNPVKAATGTPELIDSSRPNFLDRQRIKKPPTQLAWGPIPPVRTAFLLLASLSPRAPCVCLDRERKGQAHLATLPGVFLRLKNYSIRSDHQTERTEAERMGSFGKLRTRRWPVQGAVREEMFYTLGKMTNNQPADFVQCCLP